MGNIFAPSAVVRTPDSQLLKVLARHNADREATKAAAIADANTDRRFGQTMDMKRQELASRLAERKAINARDNRWHNEEIAHRNQLEADAKQKENQLLKASILEAGQDPFAVEYMTEETGVNDALDANGNKIIIDNYDANKINEILAKDPKAFETKDVEQLPMNEFNADNKWAKETMENINADPRLDTNEQRREALHKALTAKGFGDVVENETSDFGKTFLPVGNSIASQVAALNPFTSEASTKESFKQIDNAYKINDPDQFMKDKIAAYEATRIKNDRIKVFNDKAKAEEDKRIQDLYDSARDGKVIKTEVNTKKTDRGMKAIVNDVRAKAAKKVRALENRTDLSLREKAGAIRGVQKQKVDAINKYLKNAEASKELRTWNWKESQKAKNTQATNKKNEILKVQGRLKVLSAQIALLNKKKQLTQSDILKQEKMEKEIQLLNKKIYSKD